MAGSKNVGAPDGSGSMAARRRLGRILTQLREARDITQEEAAEFIERVPSTLYRMEQGKPGVRIRIKQDIHGLGDLYQVDDETRAGMVTLAEATRVKGWYQPDKDILPPNFDSYLGLEQDASELDTYETELVPGLLQTERYARTLISMPEDRERDAEEIERRVRLRLRRQEILTRAEPARLSVVLDEAILRRPVGGAEVMAEQLHRINTLGELPNVSVRVLPFAAGIHEGLVAGKFIILRFPDDEEPPMAYADGLLGGLWFNQPKEIKRFQRAYADITAHALDQRRSRDLISQAAKELFHHA